MRLAIASVLALAACAPAAPPATPQEACAQRADDDPVMRETLAKAANPDWLWQNEGKIEIVRQQAIARCLQGRGGVVRGGVERPR